MNTVPTAVNTVAPIAVETVPTAVETVAPIAVETVAPIGGEVSVDKKPASTKLNKTEKWKNIEATVSEFLVSEDEKLKAFAMMLVSQYQPKSGGESMKDWTRRIEDGLGNIIAKECYLTDLWYRVDEENLKESCFSKGKYVTKSLLKVIRDAKEDVTAEVVAKMGQGVLTTDANQLTLLNPDTTELEDYTAVLALFPDKVNEVSANYNTVGKYLGQNKTEADTTLKAKGIVTVIA